jgi:putative ABC transport system permease protein
VRRTEAVVAAVLRLAPRRFRERYREEYLTTLRSRLDEAGQRGALGAARLTAREVIGAVGTVAWLRVGALAGTTRYERYRQRGGSSMLDSIRQDTVQAARTLRRNPGFTLAAVAVSALGIGATTAIFSAANAFFFRPLPFADADRLVLLFETNPEFGWTDVTAAPANALDWRDQVDAFADVAAYRDEGVWDIAIHTGDEPVLVGGSSVTGNFFDVLGVRPAVGRGFTWDETWSDAADVVVLSHAVWVSRFGADPNVIGSTIPLRGAATPHEIIGVMPEGFAFPTDDTQLWLTYGWDPSARNETFFRRGHYVRAVARLEPGVSVAEADAQLQSVVRRLQVDHPETNRVMGAGLMPMRDFLIRGVKTPLAVLLGAVGILLVLACANVANLMLVRASDRLREVALRHALGAGRARIARQLLVESLLIGVAGGAVGLAIGWIGVRAMSTLTRLGIEGATAMALDGRVVAFTLAVSVLSGVLFGTAPAVRSTRGDVQDALRDGGRGHSAGRRGVRTGGLLVAAEVALALVLVVGAGLMIRSSYLLRGVDPGFAVEGALAIELSVPAARYAERDQVLAFWDGLEARLEGRPGIERAGMVGLLPLAGTSWTSQFQAEGWQPDRVGYEIVHRRADSGYFEALDVPLVRGRHFGPGDGPDAPLVVVINETFAREHFPGEDPIGQRIAYDRAASEESTWYEIVGIVGDQHQVSPRVPPRAEVFENRDQDWGRDGWLVMKTSADPLSAMPAVRAALAEMDPQIPIASVQPLRDVWSASMDREGFILTLLGVFGVTALLLATVGVYGVSAQAARRRTQEIGIRMALGANAPDVVALILGQGLRVIALGLLAGLLVASFATRALTSLLYGIEPTDPATLTSVVLLLGVVALVASYLPARRATALDPVESLRAD